MSLVDDPFGRVLRPQTSQNREQHVASVVTAIVERIEDDGTCRLRFFGMNPEEDGDDLSSAARVMMPMAGNRRGMHFFPERGDEVVVGFHDGDTSTPIILGAVWNNVSRPPDQAQESAENHHRTIVSRSGHELTFDDTPGSEKVTVKSQGGHTIELDDAPGRSKVTVSSQGGARSVVLDDTPPGGISIQTPTCQITMREPGVISIQSTISIAIDAPVVTINGIPFLLHHHGIGQPPVTPV
jgi:uncharacterized protein involved in type VI secretion and phage assembly